MPNFEPKEPLQPVLPELINERDVFVDALQIQMELNEQIFNSPLEASMVANKYAAHLDHQTNELFGKIITLTGMHLTYPHLSLNELGSYDLTVAEIKPNEDSLLEEPSLSGEFVGFIPHTIATDESATKFRATIHIQAIVVAKATLPNFIGPLIVTGPLESTTFEFLDDKKTLDIQDALKTLLSVEDTATKATIEQIDHLLSGETKFSQSTLHQVAHIIRQQLLNENPHLSDTHLYALLDLVRARLGLYEDEPFFVSFASSIENKPDSPGEYIIRGQLEDELDVKGVNFVPYYQQSGDGNAIQKDILTLSVIVERVNEYNEKSIVNVPFDKINTLQPLRGVPEKEA